jgi:hypothetical protein
MSHMTQEQQTMVNTTQTVLVLRHETIIAVRLWAAMTGRSIGGALSALLADGLRDELDEMPPDVRVEIVTKAGAASIYVSGSRAPAAKQDTTDGARVRTGYRIAAPVARLLKAVAEYRGETNSELADRIAFSQVVHLAMERGTEFYQAFQAAVSVAEVSE